MNDYKITAIVDGFKFNFIVSAKSFYRAEITALNSFEKFNEGGKILKIELIESKIND